MLSAVLAALPITANAFQRGDVPSGLTAHFEDGTALSDNRAAQKSNGGGVSLSEAIEQVRRDTGGRILSAETKVNGNREVHHIKVLTKDGKVKTYRIQGHRRDH